MTNHDITKTGNQIFFLGLSLMILGVLAVITPFIAGSMVVIILGIIIVLAGISSIVNSSKSNEKIYLIVLGLIKIICGVLIISHPILGLAFLTLLLAFYFIIEGVWKIIMSIQYRNYSIWVWLFLTGIISLLLGVMIWMQWPGSSLWIIGFLLGINLIFTGLTFSLFSKEYLK